MGQVTSSCMSTSTAEVIVAILLAPQVLTESWVDGKTKKGQSKKMREKRRDADYPGIRAHTWGNKGSSF